MCPSRTVSRMSSRLRREASSSHSAASLPKRETSLGSMSSQPFTQPPLRPLAPAPQYSRSIEHDVGARREPLDRTAPSRDR